MRLSIRIFLITCFFVGIKCWDLSNYNISSNYYTSSIASFGNRAFLALPRSSCHNNISNPTLVEVTWHSEQPNLYFWKKPFFLDFQSWNNCADLQDAAFLDVESMRGRLWVLDKGNNKCEAKIVVYNLFQKVNYSLEVPVDTPKDKLTCVALDPVTSEGTRAFIGLAEQDYLLVFSLSDFKWWKIDLKSTESFPISTQFLALSRKESFLYTTGAEEREIHAIDLDAIRNAIAEEENTINATYFGQKLGPSSGLVTDFKQGLIYYLIRDYAIVRWDTRFPSEAEFYNILAQSYVLLPHVSQLYTGPQNGIWALVNYGPPNSCNTLDNYQGQLQRRLVKILKYNVFI